MAAHLRKNDFAVLRALILTFPTKSKKHSDLENLVQKYTRVIFILAAIGELQFLQKFLSSTGLSDAALPFNKDSIPKWFPGCSNDQHTGSDNHLYNNFCDEQWTHCGPCSECQSAFETLGGTSAKDKGPLVPQVSNDSIHAEETSQPSSPPLTTQDHESVEYKRKAIKNKISAIGRLSKVFKVLRSESEKLTELNAAADGERLPGAESTKNATKTQPERQWTKAQERKLIRLITYVKQPSDLAAVMREEATATSPEFAPSYVFQTSITRTDN